jgi:hypothetical protein
MVTEKHRGDVSSTSWDDGRVEGLQCTIEGSSQKSTDTHVPHFLKRLCHESDTLYPQVLYIAYACMENNVTC